MIRRPPRSTLSSSSAASDVYKRQVSTQSTGETKPLTMACCCTGARHGDDLFLEQRMEEGTWATRMNMDYPGLRILHDEPRIYLVEEFLSADEIERLIDLAKPGMQRAPVVAANKETSKVGDKRTSSTSFLPKYETGWLLEKVEMLTNKPIPDMERPQVGHYNPEEFYAGHYDAVDMSDEVGAAFATNGGNRLITVLIYLNTVEEGGRTRFDRIDGGLEVPPVMGSAVVFFPAALDASIDERMLHTALKPEKDAEKWVSQVWIREGATKYT
eukprot:TRINITY_DN2601_c0_g1_i3.p1 TRINITY_DN2601_c0_g1~~TRINITY_DN2601_c0_g1_i3.p1  ORF type:complete len:271 (-),score=72.31 TRINITY_DN2601_c0_g1_i3:140-952(-)